MSSFQIPYIGVTDFATHAQVLQAVACIPSKLNRRLHVGLMTSYKVQRGIPTEMGWEKIWPTEKQIHTIFQPHGRVFNVIHYADYSNPNQTAAIDLYEAVRKSGKDVHGIQLDMVWPDPRMLNLLKSKYPNISVILQVGKGALQEVEIAKRTISQRVRMYGETIDYILIDFSLGRGEPLNQKKAIKYINELLFYYPQERIVVAGGLGPTTFQLMQPIFANYCNISCDAQGQMRASGKSTDPIEMDRVSGYLKGICSLL